MGADALLAAGWTKHDQNGCDPHLGFAWTYHESGALHDEPLVVYTTAGGQPAGVGAVYKGYGREPLPEEQRQWASTSPLVESSNDPEYMYAHVDVAFRSGSMVCDGEIGGGSVGDVIIVNPAGPHSKSIPLTEDESQSAGWHQGSCFDGMGWHRFLDTSTDDNNMSWTPENVFPVAAMYHEGEVNAIFFASMLKQQSTFLLYPNRWEPMALSHSQVCANLCDSDCNFGEEVEGGPWGTMHIYFRDHASVVCDNDLFCDLRPGIMGKMGCCHEDRTIQPYTAEDFSGPVNDTSSGTGNTPSFNNIDGAVLSGAFSPGHADWTLQIWALLPLMAMLNF